MNVETEGRRLRIGDREIEFAVQVGDIVQRHDAVIVQLDVPEEAEDLETDIYSRNVRCIEPDGTSRWMVERGEPSQGENQPYTGLWEEDGSVWAYNWNGIAYQLDLEDGTHRDSKPMK